MDDAAEHPDIARWNTRFAAPEYAFGIAPNAFLAAQAHRLRAGMTALCVADGEGRNSVWLAQQGLEVTAFDFSPAGLAKARALAASAGVRVDYRQAEAERFEWTAARYDVVVAIFIQFAPPALRAKMFDGMMAALAPGGLIILEGYGLKQLEYRTGGPKVDENLYTSELLQRSFAPLEILHLVERDDVLDEGTAHCGMSALVDLVARRPVQAKAGT
jgi:protein-L-isoaspartate O-methyltransferase